MLIGKSGCQPQRQAELVEVVLAPAGQSGGEPGRLAQRQFGGEDAQDALLLHLVRGPRVLPTRDQQDQLTQALLVLGRQPGRQFPRGAAEEGLEPLGEFARHHGAPVFPEHGRRIGQGQGGAPAALVEDQGAGLPRHRREPEPPLGAGARRKPEEQEAVAGQAGRGQRRRWRRWPRGPAPR